MIKIMILAIGLLVNDLIFAQDFAFTKDMQKREGFQTLYFDVKNDKVYLEVDRLDEDFLHVASLSSGVGSNDIGLDRGQLGPQRVVRFSKMGAKLFLVQPNLDYRGSSTNPSEIKSITQAFASSVLHGFDIIEEVDGRYLVELTPFLFQDAHGVGDRLAARGQGSYILDRSKSALNEQRTKSFEQNVEIDIMLTFSGKPKGYEIRSVTPEPSLVTVYQHHSFIALPELGSFEMRPFDARSGCYPFSYYDYSAAVTEPMQKLFIRRHRLEKKDPNAPLSEAVEPLVYYLDNGTPEPIRTALLEGARWWNQAFEAAGYKDAFRVEILPEDADPLDVRYNVIQWVHRSTRGWSYGSSIVDPRTGEILKGHVSLGSLRIRQDYLIAQGLYQKPFGQQTEAEKQLLEMALSRIRQLSAHEVGHTLGFAHNFAASTVNRNSVMDYPHMYILDAEGEQLNFDQAYETGIGAWDKVSVAYAYSDFSDNTNERAALNDILEQAYALGYRYLTDSDARPVSSASATAHLWDNGRDITYELQRLLSLREKAINQFSIDNISAQSSMAELEDVFAPVYFMHRYQTEAVSKLLGGIHYQHAYKETYEPWSFVSKEEQLAALDAVLQTLSVYTLAIPEDKLALFGPRTYGFDRSRESFKSKLGVAFDPIAAAETAADLSLTYMFNAERANRIVYQSMLDAEQLGFPEFLKIVFEKTLRQKPLSGFQGMIQEVVQFTVLKRLMELASHDMVYPQVTEAVVFEMMRTRTFLGDQQTDPTAIFMRKEIDRFLGNPKGYKSDLKVVAIPDGSPIGSIFACGIE